jgi:Zn finger protein HypA/HybF involved in hydrogenase expression
MQFSISDGGDGYTIFECLACAHESILEKLPPRCPECGSGNGVLRETPESAIAALTRSAPEGRYQ